MFRLKHIYGFEVNIQLLSLIKLLFNLVINILPIITNNLNNIKNVSKKNIARYE